MLFFIMYVTLSTNLHYFERIGFQKVANNNVNNRGHLTLLSFVWKSDDVN